MKRLMSKDVKIESLPKEYLNELRKKKEDKIKEYKK